jgi:hypothetical protein
VSDSVKMRGPRLEGGLHAREAAAALVTLGGGGGGGGCGLLRVLLRGGASLPRRRSLQQGAYTRVVFGST